MSTNYRRYLTEAKELRLVLDFVKKFTGVRNLKSTNRDIAVVSARYCFIKIAIELLHVSQIDVSLFLDVNRHTVYHTYRKHKKDLRYTPWFEATDLFIEQVKTNKLKLTEYKNFTEIVKENSDLKMQSLKDLNTKIILPTLYKNFQELFYVDQVKKEVVPVFYEAAVIYKANKYAYMCFGKKNSSNVMFLDTQLCFDDKDKANEFLNKK